LSFTSLLNKKRKLVALSTTERRYLFEAVRGLFLARLEFERKTASEIIARFSDATCTTSPKRDGYSLSVSTVGWAIGVAACHVPWRADCLIEAMAAHRWLCDYGYRTSFALGVLGEEEGMRAHAWLECEGIRVTGGGSTSQYRTLCVSPKPAFDVPSDSPPLSAGSATASM
jgi:hypothetical protein